MTRESVHQDRLARWRQDGRTKVEDSTEARAFIEQMGICTLYPASPEFPSLLLAYLSADSYKAEASWDSPGGHVYGWRWELGKPAAAFYTSVVARKPTYVAWRCLPPLLGALATRQDPRELYKGGELSSDALKVYNALDAAERPLVTGELRKEAGFPTGKENRAAYLKAVAELEEHLMLAKVFDENSEGDEMSHALVRRQYPEAFRIAESLAPGEAVLALVENHLASSAYMEVTAFARHLRLSVDSVERSLSELEKMNKAQLLERAGRSLLYAAT